MSVHLCVQEDTSIHNVMLSLFWDAVCVTVSLLPSQTLASFCQEGMGASPFLSSPLSPCRDLLVVVGVWGGVGCRRRGDCIK